MNNINATLGLSQLDTCFENIKKRKYNLEYMRKSVKLKVGYFTKHDEKSSYYLGTLILNERGSEDLRHKLIKRGCNASFHYPYLHLSQYYNSNTPLGNLEDLDDRIINLPIHQNLSAIEISKIVGVINE
jgi:dTDP-4-amino-4,6-dideoxygalactose transaminase